MFFSPALPLPWAPGAEGFLVSSLEQGPKPSPAWPHSGHSWECVSLETGWLRVQVLPLCVCVTALCLCVSGCVCDSGLVYLRVCVFPCVYGSQCPSRGQGELRAGGTKLSTGVLL